MNKLAKYTLRYLTVLISGLLISSCSDEFNMPEINDSPSESGDLIKISGAVSFPESVSTTRVFENAPDLSQLSLYLIVFNEYRDPEGNTDPTLNSLHEVRKVSEKEISGDLYRYDVELLPTKSNAIIHLIAIYDENFLDQFTTVGGEYHIMAGLVTQGDTGAYWQRIELGCPISESNKNIIQEILGSEAQVGGLEGDHLAVPLLRNFAKIMVDVSEMQENGLFEYIGFEVINTLDTGTIAAFLANDDLGSNQVRFFSFADNVSGESVWSAWDFNEINNQGYTGRRANGATRTNTIDEVDKLGFDNIPKYVYERPFQSSNHTFVIVKGTYEGKDTFYKVDIGMNDENNIFSFYNIIRNVEYKIKVSDVVGKGYDSARDAANGLASNNFSSAVETRNLLSISNGKDMIRVNNTYYVFVNEGEEFTFMFQYYENMSDGNPKGEIKNAEVKYNGNSDEDAAGIGITMGNVVKDWGYYEDPDSKSGWHQYKANEITIDGEKWMSFTIKANTPTDNQQIQTFTIYKPGGLNRTITLILRKPWNITNTAVYAGQWNGLNPPEDYINNVLIKGVVGGQKGAYLTLFFTLPRSLPEVIFPLEFVIEADRQNIQNDYSQGSAAVLNAESLFKEEFVDGAVPTRIQYVKTISWSDYDTASGEYEGTASLNAKARFLTITDLSALDGSDSFTRLRISNPYFNLGDCSFTRIQGQDPDPEPRKITWEFSVWGLNGNITEEKTVYGLTLVPGQMSYNNNGYILTQAAGDQNRNCFKFTSTVSGTLTVSASSNARNNTSQIAVKVGTEIKTQDVTGTTKTNLDFKINVNEETEIYIYPNSATATRFYSITFNPDSN